MLNRNDILSTLDMIDHQHLDIRTITLGLSLLDCADPDPKRCAANIYEKICRRAEKLVSTGEAIERELGIPIVNKRIAVTPVSMVGAASRTDNFTIFAQAMDRAAHTVGVNFIGGFSALVQKGMTSGDERLIASIPEALSETELVCASVNVGSTKAGINMEAVARMGRVIKEAAERTAGQGGMACAKLVVFCNAVEDNPFMAGAFHGAGEPEAVVNVGVSGPGVVHHALQAVRGRPLDEAAELIKKTAFRITRMGQLVAREASQRLNVPFGVVDLSLAPTPAAGDSVARILEELGLEVYITQLEERRAILDRLLAGYNDGRRKSFYCLAVYLLEPDSLRRAFDEIQRTVPADIPVKEKAITVVGVLKKAAETDGVTLKLNKKPKEK